MSNLARIDGHQRFKRHEKEDGVSDIQVEKGYTRIANELYEAVNNSQTCPVTLRQIRVLHAIMRRTYGYQKKVDRISDCQIAEDTGLSRQNVNKAKKELIAFGVLFIQGSSIGVNKHIEQWNFDARPEKNNLKQSRDTVSKSETSNVSKYGSHKRNKENIELLRSSHESSDDESAHDDQSGSVKKFPDCPHQKILEIWAELMPDKRQPMKSMWNGTRAKSLSARWKSGFVIKNERTGEPLYTDVDSGIEWWGRFFRFLRKSEFLMRDENNWFGLDWVTQKKKFEKIMELAYHGEGK